MGQLVDLFFLVLSFILASHSCFLNLEHCHQTFLCEPLRTSSGVRSPFFVRCHSFAISGERAARELSELTRLFEQKGHLSPLPVLLLTTASHSWCLNFEHCHQTFLCEPLTTSWGVRSPFLVGCHSLESSGESAVREFSEETGLTSVDYIIQEKIPTFCETFTGTNNIRYKHIYYIARWNSEKDVKVDPNNFSQMSEISDIRWFNVKDSVESIRTYNKEKRDMIKSVEKYLISNRY